MEIPLMTAEKPGSSDLEMPFVPLAGNKLALDLVNTQYLHRRKPQDLLSTVERLQQWWKVVCIGRPEGKLALDLSCEVRWDDALLRSVHELRSALRSIFANVAAGEHVSD